MLSPSAGLKPPVVPLFWQPWPEPLQPPVVLFSVPSCGAGNEVFERPISVEAPSNRWATVAMVVAGLVITALTVVAAYYLLSSGNSQLTSTVDGMGKSAGRWLLYAGVCYAVGSSLNLVVTCLAPMEKITIKDKKVTVMTQFLMGVTAPLFIPAVMTGFCDTDLLQEWLNNRV
ncbi:MAG: hypothetical protein S4CHLAM45_07040 [Chlamydiales bacterium]|nr:hypothetical protein [Chlamydiales bacterium]MCH9620278.1 hypothetical protein [Chlamydiales bacterium]MCH9622811.1 hypothetical protein [Chlamydiales bacterium]